MKKFALFAGVAAIATIGSVFAAWQFSNGVEQKDFDSKTVGISADKEILLTGLYGTATLSDNLGDGKVEVTQAEANTYKVALKDVDAKEAYKVTYTPAANETTTRINVTYTWTLIRNNEEITSKQIVAPVTITDGAAVSYQCDLSLDAYDLNDVKIPEEYRIDTIAKLNTWLGNGGETTQFSLKFSARISIA